MLQKMFEFYFKNIPQINEEQTSSQLFETKIRLKVQNKTDTKQTAHFRKIFGRNFSFGKGRRKAIKNPRLVKNYRKL